MKKIKRMLIFGACALGFSSGLLGSDEDMQKRADFFVTEANASFDGVERDLQGKQ